MKVALITLNTGKSGLFLDGSLVSDFSKQEIERAKQLASAIALAAGADLRFFQAQKPDDPFWIWSEITSGIAFFAREPQKTSEQKNCRALVTVSGGVASYVADDGVDVEVFDWDNYKCNPAGAPKPPMHFKDLADAANVPTEDQSRGSQRRMAA